MRMDRLLHMVMILLHRRKMPAKELAAQFGVSVRTVYRDMETLCQAGVPLTTFQGANGGIGIADGYRLDRTVMTDDEWASVMLALRSISSSHPHTQTRSVLDKIQALVPAHREESFRMKTDSVMIDLSPWSNDTRMAEKLSLIRNAIEDSRLLAFVYSSVKGETLQRTVEPYTLLLKGRSWYLYGYCLQRGSFRLFKLSRMKDPAAQTETYRRREVPDSLNWMTSWDKERPYVPITLRFAKELRSTAEDYFGVEQVHPYNAQGDVVTTFAYPEDEWLYGFLMSFGPGAEVLEPVYLREVIRLRAESIAAMYRQKP